MVVDRAIALRGRAFVVVDRQNRESWSWIVVVNADFVDRGRGSWSLRPRITSEVILALAMRLTNIVRAAVWIVDRGPSGDRGRGSWSWILDLDQHCDRGRGSAISKIHQPSKIRSWSWSSPIELNVSKKTKILPTLVPWDLCRNHESQALGVAD